MVFTRRQHEAGFTVAETQPPPSDNRSVNREDNMPPGTIPEGSNANHPPAASTRESAGNGPLGSPPPASVPPRSNSGNGVGDGAGGSMGDGAGNGANNSAGDGAGDNPPPGTPPNDDVNPPPVNPPPVIPALPYPPPPSISLSEASMAGPGQRGRQLMALAEPLDRFNYLTALETLNQTFAHQLRSRGVEIPRCE